MDAQSLQKERYSLLKTWLAGCLALLPLAFTLILLGWVIRLVYGYVGPGSYVGRFFQALGAPLVDDKYLSYLTGTLFLIIGIFFLGLVVRSGLRKHLAKLVDLTLRRIPVISSIYNLADRFVGLLDHKQSTDIGAMSPVWCFFGGDGVGVLALMPNPGIIILNDKPYYAVLVPTAPVPVGGGLLYVPADWVKPANIGVEKLTSIYVSMGLTPPPSLRSTASNHSQLSEPSITKE